jgi:hypothetical protein
MTAPLTSFQLMLSSSSSSTNPTTATLSPLIRYRPCETSLDGSSSSGGRIMRSWVCERTYIKGLSSALVSRTCALQCMQCMVGGLRRSGTYQVCHLITTQQRANQRPRIASQNNHFFYPAVRGSCCKLCLTVQAPWRASDSRWGGRVYY